MGIFRRNRKEREPRTPIPPPPPLESTVDDAQAEFDEVSSRDEEIESGRARLLQIRRENALGPRFWAAMGERRT